MNIIDREIENRLLHDLQNVTVSDRLFEDDIVDTGKNYSSQVSRFTVFFDKNGEKGEKSFFVKVPYDVHDYEMLKRFRFYSKEIHMYEVVLPAYQALLPDESLHPRFYGTDGKDALILEDLSKRGYRMMEGHRQLDLEHSLAALRLLAKLHALSVKAHQTDASILEPVAADSVFSSEVAHEPQFRQFVGHRLETVFPRADPVYAEQHSPVLRFLRANLIRLVERELRSLNSAFCVLNHGDFHTNNVMFAHDQRGRVTHAKCVDFQLCRWATPALDIILFSVVSVKPEVFDTHFQQLLETYVATLNATLELLKCDLKLDTDALRKDIRKVPAFWLHALAMVAPPIVSDLPNGSESTEDEEYANDVHFIELAKFWIPYFIREGVFSQYEDTAVAIDQFCRAFCDQHETAVAEYDLQYDVVKPGDNYCSGIVRMTFDYRSGEATEHGSVLLKIPSLGENYRKLGSMGLFRRELYAYETLLPKLHALWDGPPFAPACHATTASQALVLEDLEAGGYVTCDRKQQLDSEHCRAALTALATYHGLTVEYLRNRSHADEDALPRLSADSSSMMAFSRTLYDSFLKLAESVAGEATLEKLREYRDQQAQIWERIVRPDGFRFGVFVHGDFWTNNILFAYDDDGRVRHTKMIDWQGCRRASPVMDLIYFFVTSVRFEVFAAHRHALLELYANTLNETLSQLGCDCRYTRAQLDQDLDEHKVLFPIFVSFTLQIAMTDRDSPVLDAAQNNVISAGKYPSVAAKWISYFPELGI